MLSAVTCGLPICLRSADLLAFGFGVCHTRPHTASYHGKFQLAEHARHLQKSLAHGVCLSAAAIQGNTAHNHKPQMLLTHEVTGSRLVVFAKNCIESDGF